MKSFHFHLHGELTFPEVAEALSIPLNTALYKVQLTTTREPDGTERLLVKVTWPSGDTESDVEYVLDPSRNYVILRHSAVGYSLRNGERVLTNRTAAIHEDFVQTPGGTWFPTTITNEHEFRNGDDVTQGVTVSRYDRDFEVKLSDRLFAAPASSQTGIPE